MTDFSELLYFWLFLGFLGLFYGSQLYTLELILDKLKNKFDISRFFTSLYLFIIWIFVGELFTITYLFSHLTG
tara:strand:- start:3258 stop:3476 length:219 start_codon:yes stop_codon:yes gene_type:complete